MAFTSTPTTDPFELSATARLLINPDRGYHEGKDTKIPHIRRNGMTKPANFVEHSNLLMRLSVEAPALAAAWKLTKERRYAEYAATRMNPNLQDARFI